VVDDPVEQLAWHADDVDPLLGAALDARREPGRRLLDLGTGAGTVAIAAARRGFRVTATDIAPTALGRARDRAGELPIPVRARRRDRDHLDGRFDVAVDCGLLHCLPRDRWPAYASALTELVTPGGSLLVVAHQPGGRLATTPVTREEIAALLPAFTLAREVPSTFANQPARLFELERNPSSSS